MDDRRSTGFAALSLTALTLGFGFQLVVAEPARGEDEVLSVPIRWCAVVGSPAAEDPSQVGETDTDWVLWRRHERISDESFIPLAGMTLRSAFTRSIRVAEDLNFPIIADVGRNDSGQALGDVTAPNLDDGADWREIYAECIRVWREDLNVAGNYGVVGVNVRQIVNFDGVKQFAGWGNSPVGSPGDRNYVPPRFMVEDNAFRTSFSTLGGLRLPYDDVDWIVGHEVGHTLGLGHVCREDDPDNMMFWNRVDLDGDQQLDNTRLAESTVATLDDGGSNDCSDPKSQVDQTSVLRQRSRRIPGCKINGTNTDCSTLSDIRVDTFGDADPGYLDLSTVSVNEFADGTSALVIELAGPLDGSFQATANYLFGVDRDADPATGGALSEFGIDSAFVGADLVATVGVQRLAGGALAADPSVFVFVDGRFEAIDSSEIRSPLNTEQGFADDFDSGTDLGSLRFSPTDIVIELPTSLRGLLEVPFRLQAVSIAPPTPVSGPAVVDRLDERVDEPGKRFFLVSPEFPTCTLEPARVALGDSVAVTVEGLLPAAPIHAALGAQELAVAVTDAAGGGILALDIPIDARPGLRLVTVGVDGTALTADCFVQLDPFPDCNSNGLPDEDDIASGRSEDLNANGDPDECEIRQVSWIFEGTATGGLIDIVIDGWDATCMVSVPTLAGETGEMVAVNVAAVLAGEACLVDQGITATTDGNRLILEGLALGARDVDYTTTDAGLMHRTPITDIPTLSTGMLVLFALALAFLMWRRGAASGA